MFVLAAVQSRVCPLRLGSFCGSLECFYQALHSPTIRIRGEEYSRTYCRGAPSRIISSCFSFFFPPRFTQLETRFLHALGVVKRMNPITLKTVLRDSAKLFAFNSYLQCQTRHTFAFSHVPGKTSRHKSERCAAYRRRETC